MYSTAAGSSHLLSRQRRSTVITQERSVATGAAPCAASAEAERRQSGAKRSDAADYGMVVDGACSTMQPVCPVRVSFKPVFEMQC
jgi:hypothetical protein